ncbi:bifunctional DNA primase/polymerase [Mycolicibacterium austroafricanum]|uniref:bifunctional DNA primase/polymerase n=1 Tax=Mycolicibacterium austroafricanum TaxID=39687 RepID=UPI0006891844|nr:bifunctional DNA primase/polymerase [Mycolicibacterium austroafricanum]
MPRSDDDHVPAPAAGAPAAGPASISEYDRYLLQRMAALHAHLMLLKPRVKAPSKTGWPLAPAVTLEEAEQHIAAGGNIGVNLRLSNMVVLDAENTAATLALIEAGFTPTVIPAKAQMEQPVNPADDKRGGCHVWLRIPAGIDATALPQDRLAIYLPGGGKIDILAGVRFTVAPPSTITDAPGKAYAAGKDGPLDSKVQCDIDEAPMWLFDRTAAIPAALAPLQGILIPDPPRVRVARDARSAELSAEIDAVSWDDWLAGDPRLHPTHLRDGCGCQIWYWQGASNEKSATLHEGCAEVGNGAHIWSGTMMRDLNLDRGHSSRLDLAAALRGQSRREVAASVGISIGAEPQELGVITPETYARLADTAERLGNIAEAAMYRGVAERMQRFIDRTQLAGRLLSGEPQIGNTVAGAINPTPGQLPRMTPVTPAEAAVESAAGTDAAGPQPGSPSPYTGKVKVINNVTIRAFPGVAFDEVPRPRENELHEYPHPAPPEEFTPVNGARTTMLEVLPPLANRKTHTWVHHEWIFSATPGLSHVAAAADSRGLSRWGLLAALLPRVAALIPPTVRLTPANRAIPDDTGPTSAGTSINVYSVLVGPPSSGKSDTMSAAAALIDDVTTVPPGTGEGVLKKFPRGGDSEDEGTSAAVPPANASTAVPVSASAPAVGSVSNGNVGNRCPSAVLVESDEIDVFTSEMLRQGSKTLGLYRSMWMGGEVGNTTSDRERHSFVGAHTYRLGILLGAQPETAARLFDETGKGTPQRFMWLPAHQTVSRGDQYPSKLATEPVYWFGDRPSMLPDTVGPQQPVWVRPPDAAIKYMDLDRARAATANPFDPAGLYRESNRDRNRFLEEGSDSEDPDHLYAETDRGRGANSADAIANRHAVLQQLKVGVLLAALDGLAQPQDAHWHAAGAIMAVRRGSIEELVELTALQREQALRERAGEMGQVSVEAKAYGDTYSARRVNNAVAHATDLAMTLAEQNQPITRSALLKSFERDDAESYAAFAMDALRQMTSRGVLVPYGDGDTYVYNVLGSAVGQPAETAQVHVLRPQTAPPIINSVGG